MQVKLRIFQSVAGLGLVLAATMASALGPAEEGRRVYLEQNCYGCHGGRGGGGMGPAFRREGADLGDVSEAVRRGESKGMPAYPKLTAQDIQNLTAYFRSLRTSAEPTFTHWWEPVPTR
jgi:mono/diheme cytochrome c family protein